jgi:protein-L-isoaspartate(D-aspartate) O-methyltransferase
MKKAFFGFLILLLMPLVLIAEGQQEAEPYNELRENMVKTQIQARDIKDAHVLEAMRRIPRHLFVPEPMKSHAYDDYPIRIGEGQTISQPYIVALMTESLKLTGLEKVLEIGTGSGYQAAVLSAVAAEVYSIEIKQVLHERSTATLQRYGFDNVKTKHADGYFGWEEYAPFDCIMITAAVNHVPGPLLKQLKDGGRLILPLGNPYGYQNLILVTKEGEKYYTQMICGVLFVPMTGYALEK